jgi:hypothetical protein
MPQTGGAHKCLPARSRNGRIAGVRYAVLVLAGVACSSPEPPPEPEPFVAHDLLIEDFPHCPGEGAYARAFVVKILEPARERQMKEIFLRGLKAHRFTVDKRKQTVEVRFGTCAEPINLKASHYQCEAPTMQWYSSVPVEIDPTAPRTVVRFAMPPEPVRCLQGTAIATQRRAGGTQDAQPR